MLHSIGVTELSSNHRLACAGGGRIAGPHTRASLVTLKVTMFRRRPPLTAAGGILACSPESYYAAACALECNSEYLHCLVSARRGLGPCMPWPGSARQATTVSSTGQGHLALLYNITGYSDIKITGMLFRALVIQHLDKSYITPEMLYSTINVI